MPTVRTAEVRIDDQAFRAFLDLTPDGIVIIDASAEIIAVNDEAEAMFGWPEEVLLGRRIEMLLPERLREPLIQFVDDYLKDPFVIRGAERMRDGHQLDLPALRCNGEEFFVEVSAAPFLTPGGLLVASVIRDVTEKRKLRDKLQNYNRSLATEVREQTRELQDKQAELLQSAKMASLGGLIAGVAHEMNTSLGAVASANQTLTAIVEKLLSGQVDAVQAGRFRQILDDLEPNSEEALDRLRRIVTSLRAYAGLDLASNAEINLRVGLSSTADLFRAQYADRIAVQLEFDGLPAMKGRSADLNQAVMNILINSAEAIDGEGTIFVSARLEDGQALIELRDDGLGIPAEDLPHIFEPGFTTKGVRVGAGLGLAIVQRAALDLGGTAEASSEPGRGATIRLKLPL